MDKRWILIFIIMIIGVSCMYLVVENSNTVGSAISDVNKSTITIPHGFSKVDSDSNSISLANKKGDEKIFLKDLGKRDCANKSFNKKLNSLPDDVVHIKNTTNVTNNITEYIIYYQDESNFNNSMSYFYTCNHTFYMNMKGFETVDDLDNEMNFIVTTLKPDYKQTQ